MYSLGIEFSTQSVKLVVLDLIEARVVFSRAWDYDHYFPGYGTRGGVLPSSDPAIRHTSPLMLIEALDLAFGVLRKEVVDPARVQILKVDAMQHCTVYLNQDFRKRIQQSSAQNTLAEQIGPCLTRKTSPIWEDRSPVAEAAFLTSGLKGQGGLSKLTGNRAELRFPAAQILKWARESPEAFRQTEHIFLLSAFLTSILTGRICPVDTGDGWGTNLNSLDIHRPGWSPKVLSVAEEYLKRYKAGDALLEKIGSMDHYDAPAGFIHPCFVEKYGFHPRTEVLIGTGDNPATLLGCGGSLVISLGSSYTVCGIIDQILPSAQEEYNLFGYTPGTAMGLTVFTNGGKVHDEFARRFLPDLKSDPSPIDWKAYLRLAGDQRLSGDERLLLPYLFDESVPLRKNGIVRFGFSDGEAASNIRALHLSQVLSLKTHSSHLGEVEELCIVAGGSKNILLRQWIADAFGAETYSIRNAEAAAPFGCALSGAARMLGLNYQEAAKRFIEKEPDSICRPLAGNVEVMKDLVQKYRKLEKEH